MLPLIKQGRDLLVIEKPSEWDKLPENSKISKLKKKHLHKKSIRRHLTR